MKNTILEMFYSSLNSCKYTCVVLNSLLETAVRTEFIGFGIGHSVQPLAVGADLNCRFVEGNVVYGPRPDRLQIEFLNLVEDG